MSETVSEELNRLLTVRVNRLEKAVQTMAWWLVQCQTGFGTKDAEGIENIIEYGRVAKPEEPKP